MSGADEAPQFLDTNVFVYAHDVSAGAKRDDALSLLRQLVPSGRAAVSVQVLQELFVTLTRKIPDPLGVPMARQIVSDLSSVRIHAPGPGDVLAAIDLHHRFGVSFWDAMILQSAHQLGCDVIWSEDLSSGQVYGDVQVETPFGRP